MSSTYIWAISVPLMRSKEVLRLLTSVTPDHNSRLMPWTSPDTFSLIDRTQLEAGFVTKHYMSSVSMIPS
ncbi:hypothetical protein TNCV_2203081 [Trichonephila clavipes]|uniref:Uncharacterized protein n=1 Tax=Trichonephila clavipes TaxID=2585209 RepID=A0A8X6S8Q9_TRICX|nr:hypothetical protein TNCV_2203081 [Trichonephila clavipes]